MRMGDASARHSLFASCALPLESLGTLSIAIETTGSCSRQLSVQNSCAFLTGATCQARLRA